MNYTVTASFCEEPLRETDSFISALGAFWKAVELARELRNQTVQIYRETDPDLLLASYDRDGESYYGLRYDEFRLLSPRRRQQHIYNQIGEFQAELRARADLNIEGEVPRYDLSAEQAQAWANGTRAAWEALVWEYGPACYQYERLAH